jgi:23S rRNA (cytidine1920-2'-O)/16S rRNA (cytidine1409-2'-O)-methyltransferase
MKRKAKRKRLDEMVVERGLAKDLATAKSLVLAGEILIDGQRVDKSGTAVRDDAKLQLKSVPRKYVSRGGLKLEGALQDFCVDVKGKVCMDVGSSTGGFTDCLLQHDAKKVYAVDVSTDQLDWKLQKDGRVIRVERNARELNAKDIAESIDLMVMDVSFISLAKVLAPAVALAKNGANFLCLIKPQFELPREDIGSGGIVKAKALHEKAIAAVQAAAERLRLVCIEVRPSRVTGAEGNQEYFLYARKTTEG